MPLLNAEAFIKAIKKLLKKDAHFPPSLTLSSSGCIHSKQKIAPNVSLPANTEQNTVFQTVVS